MAPELTFSQSPSSPLNLNKSRYERALSCVEGQGQRKAMEQRVHTHPVNSPQNLSEPWVSPIPIWFLGFGVKVAKDHKIQVEEKGES